MKLYDIDLYMDDLRYTCRLDLPWENMENKCLMISGATGLIGSMLVRALHEANVRYGLGIRVIASVRDAEKAGRIYGKCLKGHTADLDAGHRAHKPCRELNLHMGADPRHPPVKKRGVELARHGREKMPSAIITDSH